MLLGIQQIAMPGKLDNEPVFESDIVIAYKFQPSRPDAIGTGLWVPGKRINDIASRIDNAFVGKALPGKTTVRKFDRVAFKRGAKRLVLALVIGAAGKQNRGDYEETARKNHYR